MMLALSEPYSKLSTKPGIGNMAGRHNDLANVDVNSAFVTQFGATAFSTP